MESPVRRSAIPVSKSTPARRLMSRSMSKSNENLLLDSGSDPVHEDLRTFTLLEENIALKETRDSLINKNVDRKLFSAKCYLQRKCVIQSKLLDYLQ